MACDVNQLLSDACTNKFSCLPSLRDYDIVLAELLCEIKDGLAGGISGVTGVYAGNYGGVAPVFVPASSAAIAIDTTTGTQWNYFSGSWH